MPSFCPEISPAGARGRSHARTSGSLAQALFGNAGEELRRLRIHSYSDRIRYYWAYPEVEKSVETLLRNLSQLVIPETLLSDYFRAQYVEFRAREMDAKPLALILDVIGNCP
jgi:D-tagatose-1,6-bisphosphate aldolase subunit GatZ/KbaZ